MSTQTRASLVSAAFLTLTKPGRCSGCVSVVTPRVEV